MPRRPLGVTASPTRPARKAANNGARYSAPCTGPPSATRKQRSGEPPRPSSPSQRLTRFSQAWLEAAIASASSRRVVSAPGILGYTAYPPRASSGLPRSSGGRETITSALGRSPAGGEGDNVLLLLARLGFRAREVAALELGDLDWRRREVVIYLTSP